MKTLAFFLGALVLPMMGCAQSKPAICAPQFTQATVRVMPVEMPMQAAYVTIHNPCKQVIEITSASSSGWADVSLHSTQIVNGVSKMRAMPVLTIAPGATVQMHSGGTHIMLMSPTRKVRAGDRTELTFTLRDGRTLRVPFAVKPI
ncbi:copper chaperone PCu(A)C [Lysobacter sp. HDW10]|uniref:copper chaperone PCu(A)C n=1 Tax=Lysobacter sp. HDW10 TaxID=2714936 RepID=UPI00140C90BD|nr:copper chaperone PCu(A)C [Lysobacter sp. HDW10]QIK80136.1 copper chaperone PCu(A)C [Lysobacter sp. HDW10]